jgi:hypothetical protein
MKQYAVLDSPQRRLGPRLRRCGQVTASNELGAGTAAVQFTAGKRLPAGRLAGKEQDRRLGHRGSPERTTAPQDAADLVCPTRLTGLS